MWEEGWRRGGGGGARSTQVCSMMTQHFILDSTQKKSILATVKFNATYVTY